MTRSLNQCNFIGNLGKDPTFKAMPNGDAVVNFSIACSDDFKSNGERVEKTNWINIVCFRKLGELVNTYCKKGSKVFVSGKQQTRMWQAEDGSKRYSTEIVANDVQYLDPKPEGNQEHMYQKQADAMSTQSPLTKNQPNAVDSSFDDDVAF